MLRYLRLVLPALLLAAAFFAGRLVPSVPVSAVAAPPGPSAPANGGPAVVAQDAPASPSGGGGSLVKVIGPLDFVSSNSSIGYRYDSYLLATTLANGSGFYAPIDLPQGATITQVTYFYYDNALTDLDLSVQAISPEGVDLPYATATSAGTNSLAVQSKSVVTSIPIDNGVYRYYVRIEMRAINGAHQIAGVKLAYTNPVAAYLPVMQKP
jgi:hypothetical protein